MDLGSHIGLLIEHRLVQAGKSLFCCYFRRFFFLNFFKFDVFFNRCRAVLAIGLFDLALQETRFLENDSKLLRPAGFVKDFLCWFI